MARVYTFADHRDRAAEMLALEQQARAARRGIWADSFYRIRSPQDAATDVGSFQLVEGRVLDAARVKSRTYLNFGPDWRTDFTISVSVRALSLFDRAGLDPLALKGRVVRVRGWLDEFHGPMIDVTHPEQIEIVANVSG